MKWESIGEPWFVVGDPPDWTGRTRDRRLFGIRLGIRAGLVTRYYELSDRLMVHGTMVIPHISDTNN
ncbi:MAG: hypothetical protein ACHQQQ_10435 [Bacteroidota bacterium]